MAAKRCATCGRIKDETEYNWRNKRKGKKWGTCKSCQSQQRKRWYARNRKAHIANTRTNKRRPVQEARQFIWDYLAVHPCVDCGESDPVVLEFDHVRGRKKMNITDKARGGYATEAIAREIEKCVVRCANCHRRKTSQQRGWFRGT